MYEYLYENFLELSTLSPFIAIITYTFARGLVYVFRGNRHKYRNARSSPLVLRLKAKINRTYIGKLNLRSHLFWENAREKHFVNLVYYGQMKHSYSSIFKFCVGVASSFFIVYFYVELASIYSRDSGKLGLLSRFTEDKNVLYLQHASSKQLATTTLLEELKLKTHLRTATNIDFIQYGKLMGTALQEEISFQNYYIAYLKDRSLGTNSKLPLETYIAE